MANLRNRKQRLALKMTGRGLICLFLRLNMIFMPQNIPAPVAAKKPVRLEKHGDVRTDDYYWMRERENPEVVEHLKRENDYYAQMTASWRPFEQSLFEEMKARIKEDDASVPYFFNGYYYFTRYETGKNYPIYSRRKESLEAPEEIMFDVNEMAVGHSYFKLAGISVMPDNQFCSFAVDTVGRRIYTEIGRAHV